VYPGIVDRRYPAEVKAHPTSALTDGCGEGEVQVVGADDVEVAIHLDRRDRWRCLGTDLVHHVSGG